MDFKVENDMVRFRGKGCISLLENCTASEINFISIGCIAFILEEIQSLGIEKYILGIRPMPRRGTKDSGKKINIVRVISVIFFFIRKLGL